MQALPVQKEANLSEIAKHYGPDNVKKLAAAYEAALQVASSGGPSANVDRNTRLRIVRSLVAQAVQGQFDPDHLRATALSAVVESKAPQI